MNGITVQNIKIHRERKETNSYELKSIGLLHKASGSLKDGNGFTRQSWGGK